MFSGCTGEEYKRKVTGFMKSPNLQKKMAMTRGTNGYDVQSFTKV